MNSNWKKSIVWTIVLIVFGVVALFGGVKSLALLVPAAMLIWYRAGLMPGRN
jgi:hypothetical protein